MTAEEELENWLNRPEKTFTESIEFGIKVCKSIEFGHQSKYQTILNWFVNAYPKHKAKHESIEVIKSLAIIAYPQHLVQSEIKKSFVRCLIAYANSLGFDKRDPMEMLLVISENQAYQIFYSSEPEFYFELQRAIFSAYIQYFNAKNDVCSSAESSFYARAVTNLKNYVTHRREIGKSFGVGLMDVLVESSLYMLSERVFYNDIMEMFKYLYFSNPEEWKTYLKFAFESRLHVSLHCLDFVIKDILDGGIASLVIDFMQDDVAPSEIKLRRSAHILDLFRKYNIDLSSETTSEKTNESRLAEYVETCISQYSTENLKAVLILVSSIIRLIPMSLDKIIFRITISFMFATKKSEDWQHYVEYLKLVIDLFRKLSRSEKLFRYLLNSLKAQLQMTDAKLSLKRKSFRGDEENACKTLKLEAERLKVHDKPEVINEYLIEKLREEFNEPANTISSKCKKWRNIAMAWPHDSVGLHFSNFVTSLMAAPSITLWKTLIFSLDDTIKEFRSAPTDEKIWTLIDFNSAFLCEYLAGSRLPEQTENSLEEIEIARSKMQMVLRNFGVALLECEHNNQTMNAYLEVCYLSGYFDLIMAYYCDDSIAIGTPDPYKYLTKDQWVSLEQRIVNFGNNSTKHLVNQLRLQKLKLTALFSDKKKAVPLDVNSCLLSQTLEDRNLTKSIFEDPTSIWLFRHLTKADKEKVCLILTSDDFKLDFKRVSHLFEDINFLDTVVLRAYDMLAKCFHSKKFLMRAIDAQATVENIVEIMKLKYTNSSTQKCDIETLENILQMIWDFIPLGLCSVPIKPKIIVLTLALYRDLLILGNPKLISQFFLVLSKLLHFGASMQIFSYIDILTLIIMFPPTTSEEFYQVIFKRRNIYKTCEKALSEFVDLLNSTKHDLTDNQLVLARVILENQNNALMSIRNLLQRMTEIVFEYVQFYFENSSRKNIEKDREFVAKTAFVMTNYLCQIQRKNEDFSEPVKQIYRMYIGYSQNERCYPKLVGRTILSREQLGFDEAEMNLILEEMLKNFLIQIRDKGFNERYIENYNEIVKEIISHQNANQLIEMTNNIEMTLNNVDSCKVLTILAKCNLEGHLRAVLNSCCHILTFNKITNLTKTANGLFEDTDLVCSILELYEFICLHTIPISMKFTDDILTFLMNIKIKNYSVEEGTSAQNIFHDLFKKMVRVCSEMIYSQSSTALSRIPQLSLIYKDLLQAILNYRANRLKYAGLDAKEIETLAARGHDLEHLIYGMSKHPMEMKRIAAYWLIYTMNAMIASSKSTLRYPKIKLHIENICYALIGLCDHRAKGFILRMSNDAARLTYENLCKEYDKYHKFTGKV